jgi:hypothetical protein
VSFAARGGSSPPSDTHLSANTSSPSRDRVIGSGRRLPIVCPPERAAWIGGAAMEDDHSEWGIKDELAAAAKRDELEAMEKVTVRDEMAN